MVKVELNNILASSKSPYSGKMG